MLLQHMQLERQAGVAAALLAAAARHTIGHTWRSSWFRSGSAGAGLCEGEVVDR